MSLALCYINRIQKNCNKQADTITYRVLIIKASEDSSNQYMNSMNNILSAEKLNVIIDSCTLREDSSLLQQASNLVYPPKSQVDYRAACFCHRKLIDVGYVCSVCLSVFCSFTPICSTCDCNFQFDVSGRIIHFTLKEGETYLLL